MYCTKCGENIKKLRYYCPKCNNNLERKEFRILNYLFMCHRLPERSFFIKGKQMPLCARCTGILAGYLVGIILAIFGYRINIIGAIIFIVPTGIDGFIQYIGKWQSTNSRRLITGVLAGIGVIFLFLALKDSAYNIGKELGLYLKK